MNLALELRTGVETLGLSLQQSQFDQLLEYLQLLGRWNEVYNLTGIDEPRKMLAYHLLDSLSLAPYIDEGSKLLDVGSGAGLPGIAIALPDTLWVMLDSNARKTRFIRQAIAHCGLKNAQVVQSRVQDYHAPDSLDFIVSRAFAPLGEFCDCAAHLMTRRTRLLTMKTGLKPEEAGGLDADRFACEETSLSVPGVGEPRSLVTITAR